MKVLRLAGHTRGNRHSVAAQVREALTSSGAWITGHQEFSNLALCVNFEMERKDVSRLGQALRAIEDLELSGDPLEEAGLGEISGAIHLVFVHGEKDVRVPGPLLG